MKFFSLRFKFLAVIGLVGIYVSVWFYAANNIQDFFKDLKFSSPNYNFSFEKLKIVGFPFNLTAIFENVKIDFKVDNPLIKADAELYVDSVSLKSNLLFNNLELLIPQESVIDIRSEENNYKFKLLSNKDNLIKITEKNFFNGFKLHNLLRSSKAILLENLSLVKLDLSIKDFFIVDFIKNSKVIAINAKSKFNIVDKSKSISDSYTRAKFDVEILDNKYFNNNFFDRIHGDVNLKLKLKSKQNNSMMLAANINNIQLNFDNSKFNLKGLLDKDKKNDLVVDANFSMENWKHLLARLNDKEILSHQRFVVLNNAIKAILGNEDNDRDKGEFKIYSDKDGDIKVGKTDFNSLGFYVKQFMEN